MKFEEFKLDFLNQIRQEALVDGTDAGKEFLYKCFGLLKDNEVLDDPLTIGMGDKKGRSNRTMRVDGFAIDETDKTLILIISDYQDKKETESFTKTRLDELYWRLYNFLDEACNGKIIDYFDESDQIIDYASLFKDKLSTKDEEKEILKIKFLILTNKEIDRKLATSNLFGKSKGKIKANQFNDKPLEIDIWSIDRIYRLETDNQEDHIIIDIQNDFPNLNYKGIPCIKGDLGTNLDYEAYIAIIPGDLLAQIYIDNGSKILEGNVRAFLGTSGSKSVNAQIKATINNAPSYFFTYNNGIATTAEHIELEEINGEKLITKIENFQIINGGQTTATLAEAVLKRSVNSKLSGIFVPMKLTVIQNRQDEDEDGTTVYIKTVQNIARYANSQNKVTAADLFSNDPFHVAIEKLSKKHLAPPANINIPTGWFYERSRKKYNQEQFKFRKGSAGHKKFLAMFPKKQVINKEELARYITTIQMEPHIVSKGRNWAMKTFGEKIRDEFKNNEAAFNEFYFEKCVCAAIIFRSVDSYLEENKETARNKNGFWYKAGGYKGNIVPYTIAKLLSLIPQGKSLNWKKIWKEQKVSLAFMREIEILTKKTNEFICDSHGTIVTEYCKQESTWNKFKNLNIHNLSDAFLYELVNESEIIYQEKSARKEQKKTNDFKEFFDLYKLGSKYWENVLKISKEKACITNVQESAILQMIKLINKNQCPGSQRNSDNLPLKTKHMLQEIKNVKEQLETDGLI